MTAQALEDIRSFRNNNPGNIVAGEDWQGLASWDEMTDRQRREPRFAVFKDPEHGFRAMAIIISKSYRLKHNATSVHDILMRWAPPVENATKNYIAEVSEDLGVGPHDYIDTADPDILFRLLVAIAEYEGGFADGQLPWPSEQVWQGINMALNIQIPAPTPKPSPPPPEAPIETGAGTGDGGIMERHGGQIRSHIRTIIKSLGAIAVAKGIYTDGEVAQAQTAIDTLFSEEVVGAALLLFGMIWSHVSEDRKVGKGDKR